MRHKNRRKTCTTISSSTSEQTAHLGVHHDTVERVLSESGLERDRQCRRGASKLDPYLALIIETAERFPNLTAARMFDTTNAHSGPVLTHWLRDGARSFRAPRRVVFV